MVPLTSPVRLHWLICVPCAWWGLRQGIEHNTGRRLSALPIKHARAASGRTPSSISVEEVNCQTGKISAGFYGVLLAAHLCQEVNVYLFTGTKGHYYQKVSEPYLQSHGRRNQRRFLVPSGATQSCGRYAHLNHVCLNKHFGKITHFNRPTWKSV